MALIPSILVIKYILSGILSIYEKCMSIWSYCFSMKMLQYLNACIHMTANIHYNSSFYFSKYNIFCCLFHLFIIYLLSVSYTHLDVYKRQDNNRLVPH